jgi:hypothetical protein
VTSPAPSLCCPGEAWDVLGDVPCAEPLLPCMPGRGMIRSFSLRFRADRQRLQLWSPDLVVSDGDGPSVNAARSLGIPVMAVGHGLIFHHTHLSAEMPVHTHMREVVNVASSSWPARRRVAVHFAPVRARTPGTYVARPDLRREIEGSWRSARKRSEKERIIPLPGMQGSRGSAQGTSPNTSQASPRRWAAAGRSSVRLVTISLPNAPCWVSPCSRFIAKAIPNTR